MKRSLCRLSILLWLASAAFGQDDVVMKAMRDELSRSITQLKLAELDKPYFISYRVDDNTTTKLSATLGQLTDKNLYRGRHLSVKVRVGSFALDNTNFMSMHSYGGPACGCHSTLPLDDDYDQIRREIWLETDAEYKQAVGDLAAKRSVLEHRQHAHDLPDFSPQSPSTFAMKPVELKVDLTKLEKLVRDLSAAFHDSPEIFSSGADLWVMNNYVRFVNTEGTSFARSQPNVVLDVRASTQADDGQLIWDAFRVYADNPDSLHAEELIGRTHDLVSRMKALRTATSLSNYNGPVLFEGEAAAEVFGQVFAPALVAVRSPISDEPQFETQFQQAISQLGGTLADRVGGKVMPAGFDLSDNPRMKRLEDAQLLGAYDSDDEGSMSREIKIVENGVLRTVLAGRTPTPQTKETTGSARGMGASPGNLFLTARNGQTSAELRKQLLSMASQRGYDFGIVVRHVGAGSLSAYSRLAYSMSGLGGTSGAGIYKLFADGHEELVRADIAPVPLSAFKDIVSAGDKPVVYNIAFTSIAGAMLARASGGSGQEPAVVSYVVPALLFEEISLKPLAGSAPKPPLLSSPIASLK